AYKLNILTGDVELHNQHWNLKIAKMSLQFAVNLSGRNVLGNPFELTGEIMTEKEVKEEILQAENGVQLAWLYFLKCKMAVYLCDVTVATTAETLIKHLEKHNKHAAFYNLQAQAFHEGLLFCLLATACGETNQRRRKHFVARAEKRLKSIQPFVVTCPENFRNKALLLQAEIESIKKEKSISDISLLYHEAAAVSREEGFLHEQALALEKGGRFLLSDEHGSRSTFEARSFLVDAIKVYKEYGSRLKADQLERLFGKELGSLSSITSC
ncbi:MAG: hypothetical protein SGILL_002994, partial [Bacillariaceae sp.]